MLHMNPELRFRNFWLLLGYALIVMVVYLSVTSKPMQVDLGFVMQDKLFHMFAYFALMGWFAQVYHVSKQRLMFAVLFVILGVLMEYVQSLSPVRYYEFQDMIANALGVMIAVLLARLTSFRFLLQMFEKKWFGVKVKA